MYALSDSSNCNILVGHSSVASFLNWGARFLLRSMLHGHSTIAELLVIKCQEFVAEFGHFSTTITTN